MTGPHDWKKLAEHSMPFGRWRSMIVRTFQLPDRREAEFEVITEGDIVCVLPLTPDKRVIVTREYRTGPEAVVTDLPGGLVEPGQSPLDAARAELVGETGYEGELTFVATCYQGAYSTRVRHNFVATNCRRVADQMLDENEFITVDTMSLPEFRAHIQTGRSIDLETAYLGLDYLGLLGSGKVGRMGSV